MWGWRGEGGVGGREGGEGVFQPSARTAPHSSQVAVFVHVGLSLNCELKHTLFNGGREGIRVGRGVQRRVGQTAQQPGWNVDAR